MNNDPGREMHLKTSEWLMDESTRLIRLYQLAKTKKQKETALKRLDEITGRILMQNRLLEKLMKEDGDDLH